MFIVHVKPHAVFPAVSTLIDEADTQEQSLVLTSLIEPLTLFFSSCWITGRQVWQC